MPGLIRTQSIVPVNGLSQNGPILPSGFSITLTRGTPTVVIPGSGTHPNEPGSMIVISDAVWGSLPPLYPSIQSGSGFGIDSASSTNLSIITPTSKPWSSSTDKAIRFTYPQGADIGGGAPNTLTNDFGFRGNVVGLESGCDEIYLDFWVRWGRAAGVGNDLQGPWDDNGNAGTKQGFVLGVTEGANESHFFWNATSGFGAQLESAQGAQLGVANFAQYGFSNNLDWHNGASTDDGSWQRHTIYAKSNSGTSFNGLFKYWRNSVLLLNMNDVKYFVNGVTKRFGQIQITPTYGGGTNDPPVNLFMDFGPWYVSGKVNGF